MAHATVTALERFEAKYIPEPNSGCWLWLGGHNGNGYGVICVGRKNGRSTQDYAHRFSFETFVGIIPEGKEIDHICKNRFCVNPQHLEPVMHIVNMHRGDTIAALNGCKMFCHRGHEFTPENTYCQKRNGVFVRRYCLECRRAYDRVRNVGRVRKH